MSDKTKDDIRRNLGSRRIPKLRDPKFPDADQIVAQSAVAQRSKSLADVMLVNPPTPDGDLWIRTQHRVGRRTRENMVWPQVSLAQMGALLYPDYTIKIVDANAERMGWEEFEALVREYRPRYYLTQVTAPTLTNDMYGVFLAKSLGAVTMGFGTHVTPIPRETMRAYPALDLILRGEPELTLREVIDTFEVARGRWEVAEDGHLLNTSDNKPSVNHAEHMWHLWETSESNWKPAWAVKTEQGSNGHAEAVPVMSIPLPTLSDSAEIANDERWPAASQIAAIKGLCWRNGSELVVNRDRPFFKSLDDLPMPLHHLLPLDKYRMPMIKGPFTFIVTSRGCPAGCKYCIKHVSYQYSVRLRSPELLHQEIKDLYDRGIKHIHMYSDLFTVNRDQVMELCQLLIDEGPDITWTCNSRVDYVDEELLHMMGKSGCMLISWGIESGNEAILKKAAKGYRMQQAYDALRWAREAGIKNWGYFIIGLPGETLETIKETMDFSKTLPLDIALFHVAAPYPGTPFFFEVVENNWFRPETDWEQVDMDAGTVLDYENLSAEDLLYWQKRAFREWAFRPGPVWTVIKSMNTWEGLKSAMNMGFQTLGWLAGRSS